MSKRIEIASLLTVFLSIPLKNYPALPPGTTPFLKKERIKLKSEEKEGCQTPQIPIPWNNPMLDVVNSTVAPSTNKNWRYSTIKSIKSLRSTQYKKLAPNALRFTY
jgi:hypothetical protein